MMQKWFTSNKSLIQVCSTSTQVAVSPWRYDADMGTTNSLFDSA